VQANVHVFLCLAYAFLGLPGPVYVFFFFFYFEGIKLFGSDLDFDKRLAVARRGPRVSYAGELLFSEVVLCSDKCSSS
jgi:hypothetical protein